MQYSNALYNILECFIFKENTSAQVTFSLDLFYFC